MLQRKDEKVINSNIKALIRKKSSEATIEIKKVTQLLQKQKRSKFQKPQSYDQQKQKRSRRTLLIEDESSSDTEEK